MGFEPENELERAMLLAASRESARPHFYRLLLDSELVVLGEFGERMGIETVENNGQKFHPVFTSMRRSQAFAPPAMPRFALPGQILFESTRGASFVINPGSELVKTLTPEEITWCLSLPRPTGNLFLSQPEVHPKRLLKALSVLFTSRSRIRAAHLAYVVHEGVDRTPHPIIGLVADGDVPRLADEIFRAAAEALPGETIDVVWLNPDSPLNELQKHLLTVTPFYRRTATLN